MTDTTNKRLLTDKEGANYVGIGVTAFRAWSERIGAVKRFGRRRLNDKSVIDQELDSGNMFDITSKKDVKS